MLTENRRVQGYRVEHEFVAIGSRIMLLNTTCMQRTGAPGLMLRAISDVTERERLIWELGGQKGFGEKLIDSVRESLLVLGWDLRVHSANKSFYDRFRVRPEDTEGRLVYELGNGQWNIPKLRQILPKENAFDNYEVDHEFQTIARRIMLLNTRRLEHLDLILLAIRDVTARRQDEERRRTFMRELQHRVNNILHNVRSLAIHARRGRVDLDDFLEAFEARLAALSRNLNLLLKSSSEAIPLHEIVRVELDPWEPSKAVSSMQTGLQSIFRQCTPRPLVSWFRS